MKYQPFLKATFVATLSLAASISMLGCSTWGSSSNSNYPSGYPQHQTHISNDSSRSGNYNNSNDSNDSQSHASDDQRGMVRTTLAYPTGNKATSALLIERSAPAAVMVGQEFEYVIKATNLTNAKLDDVVISDHAAKGFALASSSPKASSSTDGVMEWQLGALPPGESKTISIRGSATGVGALSNCVSAVYASRACLTVNVVQPSLELTQTLPAEVLQCDPIEVVYSVTNKGTGTARDVVITNDLPEGLLTVTGSSKIKTTVGDLAAGETKRYKIALEAQKTGKFENLATAGGTGDLKSDAPANIVVRKPVLTIKKTGSDKLFLGRNASYTIEVTNTGDGEARNLTIADALPAGVKLVSSTPEATMANGKVTWNLGTLAVNKSQKVTLVVNPVGIGELNNVATASAFCAATVSDTAKTAVLGIPAVLLEVVDQTDPVAVGGTTTYVIRVTNQGSAADNNIQISCKLEATMELINTAGPTKAKQTGQMVIFDALPQLDANKSTSWSVTVKAVKAGDVRFGVQMKTDNLSRPVDETEATNFYK